MKHLTILLFFLLGSFFTHHTTEARSLSAATETTIQDPAADIPLPLAIQILYQALPHVNADMGESYTMIQAIRAYLWGNVSITEIEADTYRVQYRECVVIILMDDID